ncbi:MAG: hypothetical protein HDR88_08685 [Bacteroides sp.]|nr:hypothetical protein [Bacteroides sp.]
MGSKLIADAGSSTVEWSLISSDGSVAASVTTVGINALLADADTINSTFTEVKQALPAESVIDEIFYYGAGCATEPICNKIKDALRLSWQNSESHVSSDLLGAARSLFGSAKGIACILGTGSNSCFYNGEHIVSQIPSLGFILGDEGSGAALGKRLISDAFKEQLPENIRDAFLDEYHLTLPEILDKVYKLPAPNRFLASFVPFLHKNLWNPYIFSLVLKELTRFVKRNVAMYKGAHSVDVCFTGSIAFYFERVLREAVASQGYRVTRISKSPMEGLIAFHTSHL